MSRKLIIRSVAGGVLAVLMTANAAAQTMDAALQQYLQQTVGLQTDQMAALKSGKPVARSLHSRGMQEIYLVGAIYIDAPPESYAKLAVNMEYIRKLAGSIGLGVFHSPPELSDLAGFTLTDADVQTLKSCRPDNCTLQLSRAEIGRLQQAVKWNGADVDGQADRFLQQAALARLTAYQSSGNAALGIFDDKHTPTDVEKLFASMVEHNHVLPPELDGFRSSLLQPGRATPAKMERMYYWSDVKFGFKPTLRLVEETTLRGAPTDRIAIAVARKQIYSTHYFKTALDISYCMRPEMNASSGAGGRGFYLVMTLSSEMGLEGLYGELLRAFGVNRSQVELERTLQTVKQTLESGR